MSPNLTIQTHRHNVKQASVGTTDSLKNRYNTRSSDISSLYDCGRTRCPVPALLLVTHGNSGITLVLRRKAAPTAPPVSA